MDKDKIFYITSLKSVIIKNCIEIIKPFIKETNISINKDGLKISTYDISKVSITHIKLDANKFESFYCKKPVIIGVDTTILFKTLKSANRKDTINLYMDESDQDKLCIELADSFAGKIKTVNIPLLSLEDKILNIPSITFDCIVNIPTTQFQQIIKDINMLDGTIVEIKSVGKQVIFSCDDGLAEFKTMIAEINDNLNNEQKTLLHQNGEDIKSIYFEKSSDKIVQGKYKLSFLMYFIKASHLCENMNILLTNDKPLILEYFVADIGVMRFLLAGI